MAQPIVGVVDTLPEVFGGSFKQSLLLFERIACPAAARFADEFERHPEATHESLMSVVPGLRSLIDQGIVVSPPVAPTPLIDEDFAPLLAFATLAQFKPLFKTLDHTYRPENQQALADFSRDSAAVLADINSRKLAAYLRTQNERAVPITLGWTPIDAPADRAEVLSIVIHELPAPGEAHSFDDLLAFKRESGVDRLIVELRDWMNQIASGSKSADEVSEKLEYLITEYRHAFELERMERTTTLLETFIFPAKGVVDYVTTLASNISSKLFTLRKQQISLAKAELKLPGHEIAYIVKARQRFA